MPDYDEIHDGPGPYQKPCKQMLAGMPIELVADSLLRPIISTLKRYDDDSIAVLLQVSDHLNQLPGPLFSNTIDWAGNSKAIDQIIQKSSGKNKRGLNTITRIAKRQLQELQTGVYTSKDMTRMLLDNYVTEILKDCFEEPMKRLLQQSEGAYSETHLETLAHLRPTILPKIDSIVKQVVRSQSVASLRKPPRITRTRVVPTNISNITSVYAEDLDTLTL